MCIRCQLLFNPHAVLARLISLDFAKPTQVGTFTGVKASALSSTKPVYSYSLSSFLVGHSGVTPADSRPKTIAIPTSAEPEFPP